ncbi:epoxide hydrolase N-terminal domain-containing protein [Streptomyces sp. NPDC048584]|uniref:epoxide hydrolase N-terminal domain-containing protein n=1 Tax=Streptomyces sp. NPDC048584 TaxID=3365573 RepID=UPI00371C365C
MTDHPPLIAVTDAELEDLRARLRATRWPVDGWEAGADTTEVRRLAEYWATGYDWRTHAARINALPHHTAVIGGTPVHYLRFNGERPGALLIVLTHGWPSTFPVRPLPGPAQCRTARGGQVCITWMRAYDTAAKASTLN